MATETMTKTALESIISKEDYKKVWDFLNKKADEYASTGDESGVHDEEYNINKGTFEVCMNFEIKVEHEDIYDNGEDIRVRVSCECKYADIYSDVLDSVDLDKDGYYCPDVNEVSDHTDFEYTVFN